MPDPLGARIDALRAVLDPVQHGLIPAHVTLCRDQEAARAAVEALAGAGPLTMAFGAAEVFDGHGLRLPCVDGVARFAALRARLLGDGARPEAPHITLAHPRNPKAEGNSLAHAQAVATPVVVTVAEARLIEQSDGAPWRTLAIFPLGTSV